MHIPLSLILSLYNIWWRVNHNAPHCVIFFTSKYSPEHPVIQHSEFMFVTLAERHTYMRNSRYNFCFNVLIFRFLCRDMKIEDSDHKRYYPIVYLLSLKLPVNITLMRRFWTEWCQHAPGLGCSSTHTWMQFRVFAVIHKYLYFVIFWKLY